VAGPEMLPFCWLLTDAADDGVDVLLLMRNGSMMGASRPCGRWRNISSPALPSWLGSLMVRTVFFRIGRDLTACLESGLRACQRRDLEAVEQTGRPAGSQKRCMEGRRAADRREGIRCVADDQKGWVAGQQRRSSGEHEAVELRRASGQQIGMDEWLRGANAFWRLEAAPLRGPQVVAAGRRRSASLAHSWEHQGGALIILRALGQMFPESHPFNDTLHTNRSTNIG
jgi:hypothetical protein